MTVLDLVLVPLLVLPIVLLFRFVGCGTTLTIAEDDSPPRYRDYILPDSPVPNGGIVKNPLVKPNANNVIAYWRLLDPDTYKVAADISTAAPAKDQKGFQDGIYVTGPLVAEPPDYANNQMGSEAAPGNFIFGQPSLIVSDPGQKCRLFNGGYVVVPFKRTSTAVLYTEEFTIEAWVDVEWGANIVDYEHVLFYAGGRYRPQFDPSSDPTIRGFTVFADRYGRWQVRLAPANADLFPNPPIIPRDVRTHVAVSVKNEVLPQKRVRLFVDGKEAGNETVLGYLPPFDAPLYIGVSNKTQDPANPSALHRPILSRVQEVVLHNTALSVEEIENHFNINR
jgi:hypothetical protein